MSVRSFFSWGLDAIVAALIELNFSDTEIRLVIHRALDRLLSELRTS
jgi:hypothetical protein